MNLFDVEFQTYFIKYIGGKKHLYNLLNQNLIIPHKGMHASSEANISSCGLRAIFPENNN